MEKRNIVAYRNENGIFTSRKQLLKVPRLGPAAFTQCAGFLRIVGGTEPLDATAIHPESYEAARRVMQASGITQLGTADAVFNDEKIAALGIDAYTLQDIKDAIRQPLRDYRDQFEGALLKSDVLEIKDLHIGDQLSGTVRNVVDFGAFVDIGLHADGLVHITRMSMNRISHPSEVVAVGDIVQVYHKTHLYDAFGFKESDNIKPGDKFFEPIDTPFGKIGLFVCYEVRFPEIARYQRKMGADIIIMPTAWVKGDLKSHQFRTLITARAIENTVYLCACDLCGVDSMG